jgi:regulator of nucleoside diphosphate kinase
MKGKSVVITEADFDRLSGLVQSPKARISYGAPAASLEQELRAGEVIAPMSVPRGIVTMNSKVRVRDLETHEREIYTLVYPRDADIIDGRISVLAPLGRALLGAKVGAVVIVDAPAGVRKIKIERILYQPEAAGDLHL